jgi:hypothetical protein
LAYDFSSQLWSLLFDDKLNIKNQSFPQARANSGVTISGNQLYVFGGTDGDNRFDDFWNFNLEKLTWTKLSPKGAIPESRSSTTLIKHPESECLLLFGGIHDITHEKNDLCLFKIASNEWQLVEEDTSHKVNEKKSINVKEKDHADTY